MAYPTHIYFSSSSSAASTCLLEIAWLLGDLAEDASLDRHLWPTFILGHALVYDGALAESDCCYMLR